MKYSLSHKNVGIYINWKTRNEKPNLWGWDTISVAEKTVDIQLYKYWRLPSIFVIAGHVQEYVGLTN